MRIAFLNQLYLPRSAPRFHLAFPLKGTFARGVFFEPDQAGASIFMGKAFIDTVLMLLHARANIICLPNIERTIAPIGENINIEH